MAIFHQRAKILSRSKPRGCVSAAAYQSGEKLFDRRTGEMKSYGKDEVAVREIMAPEGAPIWVFTREELWNRVEEFEDELIHAKFDSSLKEGEAKLKTDTFREKRLGSAQLAQTMECSLPKELNLEQNIELVETYLKELFVSRGFVVDYAIHMNEGNPHVHYMVPLRVIDGASSGKGFAVKKETSYRRQDSNENGSRNLFDRVSLKEGALLWARITNQCLEKAGFDERIDARSYAEQGVDTIPTKHRGYNADKIEKGGGNSRIVQENREIALKNAKILLNNPSMILKRVALKRVVFTRADVEREIFRIVGGEQAAYQALKCKVEGLPIPANLVSGNYTMNGSVNSAEFLEELGDLTKRYASTLVGEVVEEFGKEFGDKRADERIDKGLDRGAEDPILHENTPGVADIMEKKEDKVKTDHIFSNDTSNVLKFSRQKIGQKINQGINKGINQGINKGINYAKESLLGSSIRERAIHLGVMTRHGEKLYTTKSLKDMEDRIVGLVDALHDKAYFGKPSIFHRLKERFIPPQNFTSILEELEEGQGFQYSSQQKGVIEHLVQPSQIQVLSGRAGTGKSTVLKAVSEVYSKAGYKIMGVAFQGKVSEALEKDLGQPAYTLSKLDYVWDYGETLGVKLTPRMVARLAQYQFTDKHVVILDEGSMVSDTLWERLLDRVQQSGAKLIVVQDQAQIKALYGLDISRYVEDKVGSIQLNEVMRQKVDWQRNASVLLNDHRVSEGLALYDQHQKISFGKSLDDQKNVLVEDFLKDFRESFKEGRNYSQVIGTLSNKDVDDLNQRVLSKLLEGGDLPGDLPGDLQGKFDVLKTLKDDKGSQGSQGKLFQIKLDLSKFLKDKFFGEKNTQDTEIPKTEIPRTETFAIGARIVFTRNDAREKFVYTLHEESSKLSSERAHEEIKEGNPHVDKVKSLIKAGVGEVFREKGSGVRNGTMGIIESYDAQKQEVKVRLQDKRLVGFSLKEYDHIALSYALTINKLQGSTFDKTFNLYNRAMDANKLLVMMTRHKVDTCLYVSGASNIHEMASSIGRSDRKDLIRDYSLNEEQQKFKDKVVFYRENTIKLGEALALKRDLEKEEGRLSVDHPLVREIQALGDGRRGSALEILKDWKDTRLYVMQEGIRLETIEVHAGVRERSLSRFEVEAVERVEAYFKASGDARSLYRAISKTHPGVMAKDHEDYKTYEVLRYERNALAYDISKNSELHRRFLRMERVSSLYGLPEGSKEAFVLREIASTDIIDEASSKGTSEALNQKEGYKSFRGVIYPSRLGGMKAILSQALQHERSIKRTLETTDPSHREFLRLVDSFRENMKAVGQGYHQLKSINQGIVGQGLVYHMEAQSEEGTESLESSKALSKFVAVRRDLRDRLAIGIVREMEKHEWAYGVMRETLGEDWRRFNKNLIKYAYLGKLREYIDRYEQAVDVSLKVYEKVRIGQFVFGREEDQLSSGAPAGVKSDRYSVFKERGLVARDFRAKGFRAKDFTKDSKDSRYFESLGNRDQQNGQQKEQQKEQQKVKRDLSLANSNTKENRRISLVREKEGKGVKGPVSQKVSQKDIKKSYALDYKEIRDRLSIGAEDYARSLLGVETSRSGKELVWKNNISKISLNKLTGQWQDFKTGEKGDLIALTSYVNGGDRQEAYHHAARYLGIEEKSQGISSPRDLQKRIQERQESLKAEDADIKEKSKAQVDKLVSLSKPLQGTLAEKYLREHRGIKTAELNSEVYSDLRYLEASPQDKIFYPALLSLARDKEGVITGCQVTYLDPETGSKAQDMKVSKRSYGQVGHSFVQIQKGEDNIGGHSDQGDQGDQGDRSAQNTLYVAEGVETALSLKESGIQGRIVAGLGLHNLGKADHLILDNLNGPLKDHKIILIADNDGEDHPSRRQVEKIVEGYRDRGIMAQIIMPEESGTDFNDTLKQNGPHEVKRIIEQGITLHRIHGKNDKRVDKTSVKETDHNSSEDAIQSPSVTKEERDLALQEWKALMEEKYPEETRAIRVKFGIEKSSIESIIESSDSGDYTHGQHERTTIKSTIKSTTKESKDDTGLFDQSRSSSLERQMASSQQPIDPAKDVAEKGIDVSKALGFSEGLTAQGDIGKDLSLEAWKALMREKYPDLRKLLDKPESGVQSEPGLYGKSGRELEAWKTLMGEKYPDLKERLFKSAPIIHNPVHQELEPRLKEMKLLFARQESEKKSQGSLSHLHTTEKQIEKSLQIFKDNMTSFKSMPIAEELKKTYAMVGAMVETRVEERIKVDTMRDFIRTSKKEVISDRVNSYLQDMKKGSGKPRGEVQSEFGLFMKVLRETSCSKFDKILRMDEERGDRIRSVLNLDQQRGRGFER
jgi:ATP-dependent exoDNAse (exonuclease V) alpha subunit